MATDTNTTNPFPDILQFYLDQAEKITPVINQGIDDYFTVYNKIWTEGMRLQSGLVKKITGNTNANDFTEKAKNLGEKLIAIQKEFSTGMVNIGMKGIKSIIEAVKKNKTATS